MFKRLALVLPLVRIFKLPRRCAQFAHSGSRDLAHLRPPLADLGHSPSNFGRHISQPWPGSADVGQVFANVCHRNWPMLVEIGQVLANLDRWWRINGPSWPDPLPDQLSRRVLDGDALRASPSATFLARAADIMIPREVSRLPLPRSSRRLQTSPPLADRRKAQQRERQVGDKVLAKRAAQLLARDRAGGGARPGAGDSSECARGHLGALQTTMTVSRTTHARRFATVRGSPKGHGATVLEISDP